MSLLSVYQAHVAVCSQMAASAKDLEIRNCWVELADQWRQKAKACEGLPTAPPPSQPSPQPEIGVAPILLSAPTISTVDAKPTLQPPAPRFELAKAAESHATGGDHDWKRLLADIRGK